MNKQSASTALEESPSSRAAASPHNELLMRFPLSGQLISISPDMRFQRTGIFSQLSGGQQQRAAIGRALMTKPSLILADEPTGNLDSKNSRDVIRLLKETGAKYDQTILMITHSRNVAESADRILRVSDGIITDLGRHEEV